MSYRNLPIILLFAMLSLPAQAASPTIADAWFRALPNGLPSGGYFTLKNDGSKPLAITGATSPACAMLMLHKSEQVGGMNRMTMVDRVDVPAGGTVKFSPGGYHLMCMNPGPAMKPGQSVSVALQFADGTSVTAKFSVKGPAGK